MTDCWTKLLASPAQTLEYPLVPALGTAAMLTLLAACLLALSSSLRDTLVTLTLPPTV